MVTFLTIVFLGFHWFPNDVFPDEIEHLSRIYIYAVSRSESNRGSGIYGVEHDLSRLAKLTISFN